MSYDLMFQKAIDLQNMGALNEAYDIYQKILEVMPYNSDVWNLMGLIFQSKGEDEKAVDCFLDAIKYSKKPFSWYYFNLGLSYMALNKKVEAKEALRNAIKHSPELKEGWNYLGIIEGDLGNIGEAVKCFSKALEIDIEYKDARANLCFYTNDKEKLFYYALADEGDFRANFNAGRLADNRDDKEKFLLRALKIDEFNRDVLLMLSELKKENGEYKSALTLFYKVLNLEENNTNAILGIADIYLLENDLEKSQKFYLKSFDIRRDLYGAHLNYGTVLYKQNRLSEALEEYREAVRLSGNENAEVCYNLALLLKDVGEYEEALGLMFNAHIKDRENKVFEIGIAETLYELYLKNAELALKIAINWQKFDENNIFSKRILLGMNMKEDILNDKEYAKKLFDEFSYTFDDTIKRLESKIIERFIALKGEIKGNILELGCGTGIFGEALKGKNVQILGVDISSGMLKVAEKKKVYSKLVEDDIESFLSKNDIKEFDFVVAFDVFSYLGSLENVFKNLKGKEIWFSVEKGDENLGKDYYLEASGRYKHTLSYLKKIKEKFAFKEMEVEELVLRLEANQGVEGYLIKLK